MHNELQLPKNLRWEEESLTATYGKLIIEPLERGYGVTLGNVFRRILLSSIPGAAFVSVKIDGITNEFESIPGVQEDTIDILLNLKNVHLRLIGEEKQKLYIESHGPKQVTAKDIQSNQNVVIVNPEQHIATLNEDGALRMELDVAAGIGYVPAERNKQHYQHLPVGTILLDSIFSPIRRVNYQIEQIRVGQQTDFEKLTIQIWTNGAVAPQEAIKQATDIIDDHIKNIKSFLVAGIQEDSSGPPPEEEGKEKERELEVVKQISGTGQVIPNDILDKTVDDLELSVRAFNCLKSAGIKTIRDLILKTEAEMLKYRNFGRKSLNEIKELLAKMGLSLGCKLNERGQVILPPAEEIHAVRKRGRKPSK
ncbi:MAG: DNA-directed RNA polymerase subunit alpha [bacterium]|nr:DNA-directed RNA polymerase subunit alpha [bacterium]